ncbi:capsule biosynthesis protein CapA [Staphylococcus lugdunensis]|uniref:Capsular polysaccharide type 8 biosynthesis protein cap8A n=1 Tax=Staphylococcus lugdunensis TaxID=28035 RepID=A0A133Q0E0_STALU|nr:MULTISPECIES: Wzz/FepE/Etk N-terminal domain-containing protein [Staphylococcus]ADC86471.1 capsular polysaccharide synthesis enzyme CapA [Staphylococcus lugdunensis HKU09-01]AMG61934.1 capsule biosynthesis protein CapA [Staphylococcus lugdunensis]AMG64144.1 capsule biosynthesis protein CapA [Staphylococcus lugdunensis]ARB76786.1 capsule biosynthesis protein CapA [Staphylococcus lugdunensis]ARJ08215.1 capsule biosynthesis protein CapA [Staphylococcus lugdunensis]
MEKTLDLSMFITALKKNWKLFILIPVVFVVISLLITIFLMKPKYEANTQVLVNQKESNEQYRAQEVQSNIQLVNTYSEILKSPRILEDVAKKDKNLSASEIGNMLTVTKQADSQILNVSVENHSKADAERIANEIVSVFSKDMPKIMDIDNVSILSKADGTASKVSPNLSQNLAIGLVLGLVLTIVIIIFKELFDRRIKTEEDVIRELDIPVLGSIHKLK